MRIRWTKPAAEDLTQIWEYTEARFGPDQGRRAAATILEAAESLLDFPLRGRQGRKQGTRELPIPGFPFLIIYRIGEDDIQITRILHGAQKWP